MKKYTTIEDLRSDIYQGLALHARYIDETMHYQNKTFKEALEIERIYIDDLLEQEEELLRKNI